MIPTILPSTPEQLRILKVRRVLIAIVASAVIFYSGWYCLRIGFARSLGRAAAVFGDAQMAEHAATLSPVDAEAQSISGEVFGRAGNYVDAVAASNRAIQLRPRDYYLWMELGEAREQLGDREGALRAFRQATALAPSYANARWQLGNLLIRMHRYDEAFIELRRAGTSNPNLLPNLADLAWGVYRPDIAAVVAAFNPGTDVERTTLAIVLARYGQNAAAVEQFRLSGSDAKKEAQTLLDLLLQARAFNEAYQVWARLHGVSNGGNGLDVVRDGGFEEPLLLGEKGFAWRITSGIANVVLSVDPTVRQSGAKSLRIDFRGNSPAPAALLTQTVLVTPGSHYQLTFAARASQLISGALPVVRVTDASDKTNPVLAESPPVRSDFEDWKRGKIDFTSGPQTRAIVIAIQRQGCANDPCPAYGTVWWDSFILELAGAVKAPSPPKKIDAFPRS